MSKIEVNEIDVSSGSSITIGSSGKTISLATGASASGFGAIDWDTTAKTSTFSAVAGKGYFCNTSGSAFTVNLPAGAVGNQIQLTDYSNNFATNNLTVAPNGSEKIGSVNASVKLNTSGQSVIFLYVDSTQGWVNTLKSTADLAGANYPTATGGNTTLTVGDYKTHVFTSPGTFTVSAAASTAPNNTADYLIVAGGASGGTGRGGGGGAGGFRISNDLCMPTPTMSPLINTTGVTLSAQAYPIVFGAGGAAKPLPPSPAGNPGSNSSGLGLTSAGGGAGGAGPSQPTAEDGGSGGGGNFNEPGDKGSGNTPPVSPPQCNDGGVGSLAPESPPNRHGGGGGGAGAAGSNETGGAGSYVDDNFMGPTAPSYGTPGPVSSTRYFAGGGGAGFEASGGGVGGAGGGANGGNTSPGSTGTTNTGGGGGATGENSPTSSGAGGSGIVMIRYKFQ